MTRFMKSQISIYLLAISLTPFAFATGNFKDMNITNVSEINTVAATNEKINTAFTEEQSGTLNKAKSESLDTQNQTVARLVATGENSLVPQAATASPQQMASPSVPQSATSSPQTVALPGTTSPQTVALPSVPQVETASPQAVALPPTPQIVTTSPQTVESQPVPQPMATASQILGSSNVRQTEKSTPQFVDSSLSPQKECSDFKKSLNNISVTEIKCPQISNTFFSLNSEEQKRAYSSGVTIGDYIKENLTSQKRLHITLDSQILLAGISDALSNDVKMSNDDIHVTMNAFDDQVRLLSIALQQRENEQGKDYIEKFISKEGAKKLRKNFYYVIEDQGDGPKANGDELVTINYRGSLIDGTIFLDSNYQGKKIRLSAMMPVLKDSVKLINTGGKIKFVVTALEAFGNSPRPIEISDNGVLIFEVVLENIER